MPLRPALIAACAAASLVWPQNLFAQSAPEHKPHVPLEKSIGQAKPEVVPSLFVINSRGASLKDGKLVLIGFRRMQSYLPIGRFGRPVTI